MLLLLKARLRLLYACNFIACIKLVSKARLRLFYACDYLKTRDRTRPSIHSKKNPRMKTEAIFLIMCDPSMNKL